MSDDLEQFKKDELARMRRPLTLEEAKSYVDEMLGPKQKELATLRKQLEDSQRCNATLTQQRDHEQLRAYKAEGIAFSLRKELEEAKNANVDLKQQLAASEASRERMRNWIVICGHGIACSTNQTHKESDCDCGRKEILKGPPHSLEEAHREWAKEKLAVVQAFFDETQLFVKAYGSYNGIKAMDKALAALKELLP